MRKLLLLMLMLYSFAPVFSQTKYFTPKEDKYILNNDPEDRTIGGIAELCGYNSDMHYTYYLGEGKQSDIRFIYFKIFTRDIICILCERHITDLTQQDVDAFLVDFDHKEEFDTYDREYKLTKGIENKSLSVNFLEDVFDAKLNDSDQTIITEEYGYKLFLKDGVLTNFTSLDGLNKWSRAWKEEFPSRYRIYEYEAKKYWKDDKVEIINHINIQADSHANTPEGVINPYIGNFTLSNGYVNYKMLLVTHYDHKITLREFKDINLGNYKFVKEYERDDGAKIYFYATNASICAFLSDGTLFVAKPIADL